MDSKPGYKTTEFWATVGASAIAILNGVFDLGIDKEQTMAVIGAVAAYALARGYTKKPTVVATATPTETKLTKI